MLTIRLSRVGRKNKPQYRLIISEKTKDPYGRSLEILGSYDPYTKKLDVKEDRIKHWLKNGSGMSDTVNNLLIENKIIEGKKVKATKISKKRLAKKEAEESKKKAEEPKTEEKTKQAKKNRQKHPRKKKQKKKKNRNRQHLTYIPNVL
jgi:small subunit ribosomal protein S16